MAKWKTKQFLFKLYFMYKKEYDKVLKRAFKKLSTNESVSYDNEILDQLQEYMYAIAYMLCVYFKFPYNFYYNWSPFSRKWHIAYDYIQFNDRCKQAFQKFHEFHDSESPKIVYTDYIISPFNADTQYTKGDIITINNKLYLYDGKYFSELC